MSAPLPSAVSLGGSHSGRVGIPLLASAFFLPSPPSFLLPSLQPSPAFLPLTPVSPPSLELQYKLCHPGPGRPSCWSSGKVKSYSGDDAGAQPSPPGPRLCHRHRRAVAHSNCPVVKAKGKCQLQPWDAGAISAVPFSEGPWASLLLSSGPQFPPPSARQEILQPSSQGVPHGHRTVSKMLVLVVALALGQHCSLRSESQL